MKKTIMVSNGEIIADSDCEPEVIVALHDNVTFLSKDGWSITLPEKGTYFAKYSGYFITGVVLGDSNVPEITWDGSLIDAKKIEQIYIPDKINEYINNSDNVLKIYIGAEALPSPPIISSWSSVTYGDGKFVAVNSRNIAAYSTDGIIWTKTTLSSTSSDWSLVTYGDRKFVAVTRNNNIAAYSTDGITWTQTTLPVNSYWQSVTYGDGKFVAVDNSNIAVYSTDGINWTETTLLSESDWCSVTYGDGKFICMAGEGSIEYSNDGSIWKHTDVKFITVSRDDVTDYIITLINRLIDAKLGG